MNSNNILVICSILVVVLGILWYFELVGEPIVAVSAAVVTLLGYILNSRTSTNDVRDIKIEQKNYGDGDNVGRDKIIK